MKRIHILCLAMGLTCSGVALAEGGAGLFWDNSPEAKMRSGADWGTNAPGSSALGQLEGITGQKVDRSAPKSDLPARPAQVIKRAPSAKARSDAAAMEAMAAGIMVFSLLQAMDAQADAQARAAAEAERQRQIEAERQRQLRLQAAARQRASWEAQDAAASADLGAALSGTVHSDFFGSGPAIDPAMVAGKLPGATQAEFRQAMVPPYAPPPPLPPQVNLLDKGREAVKDGAGALLRKAVDEATPEHLRNAKEAVEFVMRLDAWTRKLMDVLEPQHLTSALSDRNPAGALRTMAALERVSAEAADLSGQEQYLDVDTREHLLRIGSGRYPPRDTLLSWGKTRLDWAKGVLGEAVTGAAWSGLVGRD